MKNANGFGKKIVMTALTAVAGAAVVGGTLALINKSMDNAFKKINIETDDRMGIRRPCGIDRC